MDIFMKTISMQEKKNQSVMLCKDVIKDVTLYHHTIISGSRMNFAPDAGGYRIMTLIQGIAEFVVGDKKYRFDERVTFIPDLDQSLTINAETEVGLLEVFFEMTDEDYEEIVRYKAEFPYIQSYAAAKQYTDDAKTQKTINRIMVEQRQIPRFAMGSVESYGPDFVQPHAHPLLDQFFFSFPENNMTVLIDDDRIHLPGNTLLYIPLGSNHGVDVQDGEVMHYMWIDFMVDREKSMEMLDAGHVPTGLSRSFDDEVKNRKP